MIEKTKNILTVILVIVIVAIVVYGIFRLVASAFVEPDLITLEEVMLYTVNSNLLTNHTTYYHIENCLRNLLEGCKQSKYEEVYKLYLNDYADKTTKEEVLKKLAVYNSDDVELKKIYKAENSYILEITLNGTTEYLLMAFGNTKQASYEFAFIK